MFLSRYHHLRRGLIVDKCMHIKKLTGRQSLDDVCQRMSENCMREHDFRLGLVVHLLGNVREVSLRNFVGVIWMYLPSQACSNPPLGYPATLSEYEHKTC
jgi:hypothetical protein